MRPFPTASQVRQAIIRSMFIYNEQFRIQRHTGTGCTFLVPARVHAAGMGLPAMLCHGQLAVCMERDGENETGTAGAG